MLHSCVPIYKSSCFDSRGQEKQLTNLNKILQHAPIINIEMRYACYDRLFSSSFFRTCSKQGSYKLWSYEKYLCEANVKYT